MWAFTVAVQFYFRRKINLREGRTGDIISNGGKNGRQMGRLMRPSVKISDSDGGGDNDRSCFIFRANPFSLSLSVFAHAINIES